MQEGPYTGGAESGAFPRLNFYAQGPASGIKGSQRVLIVADSRVWAQSDDDNHRAELRKLDEAVADALEDQQMEHGDFRIHVINVGSFQPIPGNHDNIRGRRRVFTLQVVRKASAE
ncbi:MAG TPA: hypothetical protein VFR37_05050 [Longimicrobium sp.]|nr:hypothetical protein [Longimicrobium sp.]